jgi:hypothetical protein
MFMIYATYPSHLILLYFIVLIIWNEQVKLQSSLFLILPITLLFSLPSCTYFCEHYVVKHPLRVKWDIKFNTITIIIPLQLGGSSRKCAYLCI